MVIGGGGRRPAWWPLGSGDILVVDRMEQLLSRPCISILDIGWAGHSGPRRSTQIEEATLPAPFLCIALICRRASLMT
jgi:hypothetical protein